MGASKALMIDDGKRLRKSLREIARKCKLAMSWKHAQGLELLRAASWPVHRH
jgi:hypothetical protein